MIALAACAIGAACGVALAGGPSTDADAPAAVEPSSAMRSLEQHPRRDDRIGATPDDVGVSTERLKRLDAALRAYVDEGQLPGGVAFVARHGEVVYHEAFGYRDREAAAPMHRDDIFRIASQTKAVISVGVMILQEEGRLLLADPVGTYLPEYLNTTVAVPNDDGGYDVVAATRPITIRDLLTHTAGIGYGGGPAADQWREAEITGWYFAHRDEPIRETVARMASLPFEAQPGEAWVYGYATDILGALIEEVAGQPLDVFLEDRILAPLGMTDTHFYLPDSKRDRLAIVYSATDDGLLRAADGSGMTLQGEYVDGPRTSFSGGAGLLSTAGDYAKFLQMLLNGGALNGRRIVSRKTVELMTVDHTGDLVPAFFGGGMGFGLGFAIVEDVGARGTPGSIGEYLWGGAYHSIYWVDPREQLVVVYLSQVIPAGDVDDHDKLRTLVYQAIE
jgi:CubicO group peptidase (beta-lactamase class C family)